MSDVDLDGAEKLRQEAFGHLRHARGHRDNAEWFYEREALLMSIDSLIGAVQCLTEWSTHSHPDRPKDTSLRAVPDTKDGDHG